ncbi:MAG TPA: type II toxin-antitoxin system VapC family toxin [Afifellaceae bacterium]|nr:type II toxin-antitoxin system VapC family toxin [Afifellaceae bacterium]
MFLDASAIVAIIAREPGYLPILDRLEQAGQAISSPIAVWEAAIALSRIGGQSPVTEANRVGDLLAQIGAKMVPVTEEIGYAAVLAFQRYGKGTGHRAQLNLGDCFAYAMARTHDVAILYKGDDFVRTDLA